MNACKKALRQRADNTGLALQRLVPLQHDTTQLCCLNLRWSVRQAPGLRVVRQRPGCYTCTLTVRPIAQAARAEAEAQRETVAEAAKERAGTAKRVTDAVAERDLARQMLKGVQAMLGHAEAARSSALKALQQAQAEKAASQAHLPIHPPATATRFYSQKLSPAKAASRASGAQANF